MGEDLRVHHGEKLTLRAWSSGSCATGRPSGTGREGFSAGRTSPHGGGRGPGAKAQGGASFSSRLQLGPPPGEADGGACGVFPRLYPELREIHFGALEGALWETLDPRYKEALLRFQGFHPPGGESLSAFQERVFRFLEGLKAPAVLFTHGGVVRAVLRALGEDGLVPPGSAVAVDWPRRVLVRLALDGEEATG